MMAGGMEAQNDFSACGTLEAEALDTDGHPTVGADLNRGASAPNIRPPRAAWGWAQEGTLFFLGGFPGLLWGHAEFAMSLVPIVMEPQSVNVRVGRFNLGNLFAGEVRRKAALPELVFAFDLSFGLGRWSIKEADVVELESRAQLSYRVRILREEYSVIIDVDLQRSSVAEKGRRKKIEVGEKEFSIVEFGTNEYSAAIVEHIKHGEIQSGWGKPAMGRSIQLPEFTDL